MIVPLTLFKAITPASLVIAAALAAFWRWKKEASNLERVLFSLGILACLAMSMYSDFIGSRVVVVRFPASGHPVDKRRGQLLFAETYQLQNGSSVRLSVLTETKKLFGTTIVNDSAMPMRLDMISYSSNSMFALPNHSTPIPPMSVYEWDTQIDNIGPDEPPPDSMSSQISMGVVSWLTWGDSDADFTFLPDLGDAGADSD